MRPEFLGPHTVSCYAFLTVCCFALVCDETTYLWKAGLWLQLPLCGCLCVWHSHAPKEGRHSRSLRTWPQDTKPFNSPLPQIHSGPKWQPLSRIQQADKLCFDKCLFHRTLKKI